MIQILRQHHGSARSRYPQGRFVRLDHLEQNKEKYQRNRPIHLSCVRNSEVSCLC